MGWKNPFFYWCGFPSTLFVLRPISLGRGFLSLYEVKNCLAEYRYIFPDLYSSAKSSLYFYYRFTLRPSITAYYKVNTTPAVSFGINSVLKVSSQFKEGNYLYPLESRREFTYI
ncbi:hypothetical protein NEUTE2DRAFT_132550 [Neurospora tetrasperma FGSC 2509]|nr:hypothetical protein NEUTE2DRAFT_132550 [Neurospora tetrasperma FGSC 2509]